MSRFTKSIVAVVIGFGVLAGPAVVASVATADSSAAQAAEQRKRPADFESQRAQATNAPKAARSDRKSSQV